MTDSTARDLLIYLIINWINWSSPECGILMTDSTARDPLIYLIINWSFTSGRLGQSGGRCLIGHPACGVGHAGSPEVQRSRQ